MEFLSTSQVIGGKRYSTETATLLAHDNCWDGNNYERSGRNTFLFRTPHGAYFVQARTQWQGEWDGRLRPVPEAEAQSIYATLREQVVEYEDAFPTASIEIA